MTEGYVQTKTGYDQERINRVLLLSDGLANKGVTTPKALAKIAKEMYIDRQSIGLSTFGVGADYNEDLMTELAENGRGNYYFIGQADQIKAIFQQELNGLLSVVAKSTKLTITFPSDVVDVANVYGYPYSVKFDRLTVDFNDVYSEEKKAVLIKFALKQPTSKKLEFPVNLTYTDILADNHEVTQTKTLTLEGTSNTTAFDKTFNPDVFRNRVLFISNADFEKAMRMVDNGEYENAKESIRRNVQYMDKAFEKAKPDSAMSLQYKTSSDYLKEVDKIKEKSRYDIKMMQKSNKMQNYQLRKKK
jgi:Ca-activated chloride channel family protein